MARLARRPVCILPTLLALLTRTVLGKQRWNIVDAEVLCDWRSIIWDVRHSGFPMLKYLKPYPEESER